MPWWQNGAYEMKYGCLTFKNTDNLGDDIQSYAQTRFLPQIDCYVEREQLDTFAYEEDPDETVSVIMNAWFLHAKFNWPPSDAINPLFVSSHFSRYDRFGIGYAFLDGIGGEYLRRHSPIGVRDEATKEALEEREIPAYMTGCLTLTLQLDSSQERQGIVFCDVSDDIVQQVTSFAGADTPISCVSHSVNPREHSKLSYEERFAMVRERLGVYKSAKMVVTTRLHCALPCLALGTPVLLLVGDDGLDRIGTFVALTHHCAEGEAVETIKGWIGNPPENPDDYLSLRSSLEESCRKFIADAEAGKTAERLSIPLRQRYAWQKRLVADGECERLATTVEQDTWMRQLDEAKRYLEQRADSLEQWANKLEDGCKEKDEQLSLMQERLRTQERVSQEKLQEQQRVSQERLRMLMVRLHDRDDRINELESCLHDVCSSVSFRVGRSLTHLPRKVRDAVVCVRQLPVIRRCRR